MTDHCEHCGSVRGKPRSLPQHRRFFSLIRAAYAQWPEHHDFLPDSEEHLRKWLLVKADYREVSTFQLPETDDPILTAKFMDFAEQLLDKFGEKAKFGRWRGDTLAIFTAKSIAFDKIPQRDFAKLADAVQQIIEQEIGVSADDLLKHGETV